MCFRWSGGEPAGQLGDHLHRGPDLRHLDTFIGLVGIADRTRAEEDAGDASRAEAASVTAVVAPLGPRVEAMAGEDVRQLQDDVGPDRRLHRELDRQGCLDLYPAWRDGLDLD